MSLTFPDEPALVTYFTAGHPSLDGVGDVIVAMDRGGADVIEVGLPFSEPIAEGPTIQAAIDEALANGMTPDRYFEAVGATDPDADLAVMTYYNLIFHRGIERFVDDCVAAGIDGIIVPDLPVDEADELREAAHARDVDLVHIVAPTADDDRVARIVEASSGFVYVQARLGTTGARDDLSAATFDVLDRLEGHRGDTPIAVGFGVSSGEHAEAIVEGGADGVVAGSVFVDLLDEIGADGDLAPVEELTRELKQGALRGAE